MLQIGEPELHILNHLRRCTPHQIIDLDSFIVKLKMHADKVNEFLIKLIDAKIATIVSTQLSPLYLSEYNRLKEQSKHHRDPYEGFQGFDENRWATINFFDIDEGDRAKFTTETESIEIDPQKATFLIKNPLFINYAYIKFTVDPDVLCKKIAQFANKFINDDFNDGETYEYSKLKKDLIFCIQNRIKSGLPLKAIKIKNNIWEAAILRDKDMGNHSFQRPLATTLLAMEQEGFLTIKTTTYPYDPDFVSNNVEFGAVELYQLEIIISVNEDALTSNLVDVSNESNDHASEFHFIDNVLFRDHANRIIKFAEKELGYKILRFAFTIPINTDIDHIAGDLEFESSKQFMDAARHLNTRIEENFGIPSYFVLDTNKKIIRRSMK